MTLLPRFAWVISSPPAGKIRLVNIHCQSIPFHSSDISPINQAGDPPPKDYLILHKFENE